MAELIYKYSTTTSNGILSKGWYLADGVEVLVKGNSFNDKTKMAGLEPYSEVLASRLLDILNIKHVKYSLGDIHNFPDIKTYNCKHVSICERIRTNKQLVHFARYADAECGGKCYDYFTFLTKKCEIVQDVYKMLCFDAIIGNSDRHLNNFDLLYDGNIVLLATFLDNGASFLSLVPDKKLRKQWKGVGPDISKPFKDTHAKQMQLFIERFGQIRLSDKLCSQIYSEWYEYCKDVLTFLPEYRVESICSYISNRLVNYSWMFGGV